MSDSGIFKAAVHLSPERRAAYLDQACGTNHALRREVESLLRAHDEPGGFLQSCLAHEAATVDGRPLTEKPGTVIGPYKLLQQIGEGGMGVVYMAEQQEPVRRKVALKIIKPGLDSHQVIARFEAERQALAMMDHQNIARVLDAGTTESGRPFFVMELVHGVPITKFCDDNKLTPRERLTLCLPVCQAIQHAHQKGVIHRDIKPSNVLVTMYDDKPVPKVIDFGVAKAIEQRLTEKTLFTQFGALVGTLEYMSPEQAAMNDFGVDTRSDIYALGVLLYELLTGTTPLERARLREAALDEMVRLIREEEAPRPSVRLSTSGNLPKIAAARRTEPARLSTLVRGEIDWIVMKCLEKDRSRRYDTATGLARDLQRYLADEPVEACPPSSTYRLRKLVRKYRKSLATAATFVILLMAGVVLSSLLAVWATSAEREANRQRIAAESAKGEALGAKAEADKQRDEARLTAYAAGMNLASRAWEDNIVPRARELLEEVPRTAAGRDLRGFEWDYLSRVCLAESRSLEGHTFFVMCVAFSPDGQRLASGSADRTVKIWDTATGKELLSLNEGLSQPVFCVAFSPDGRRLAWGADNTVKICDSATGKELVTLKGHGNYVSSVAFSPDGQRVASGCAMEGKAKIWDSATGKELLSLGHAGYGSWVAFSPDGQRLAQAALKSTTIWDSATGKELLSIAGFGVVAFSPDGRRLATRDKDETVKIWDSATGKELLSLKGQTDAGFSIAFSPDGQRLASVGYDKTVMVWDSASGKELVTLKGHGGRVNGLAFSPDGQRLASGSDDKTIKFWDSAIGKNPFSIEASGPAAFSPDGQRLASGGGNNTVKIFDSLTGKGLLSLKGHSGEVLSVAFSPDGQRLASGNGNGMVKIWDSATGKELLSFRGHALSVHSVAFSPDGQRLASGGENNTVKVWDSATGKEQYSLGSNLGDTCSVAFSPDGRRLAVSGGYSGTVKIWDTATTKELLSLKGHGLGSEVLSVAFSPDGRRLASGSGDQTVKVWDVATGQELMSLKGHTRSVWSVAFSPDGQRLASGSGSEVKVWDGATGKELITLPGHGGLVLSVAFSPDGRRLASTNSDGSINFWEATVSPEVQERRAARQLVADLFRQRGLRADVLEWLRTVPGMSPSRRQEAVEVAQTYPEDPQALDKLARELVKRPGGEMSDYRRAVAYGEQACQLEPQNGLSLTTLGMACYRVGTYDRALETLLRAAKINHQKENGSVPADLAFLAMTQQRLGHAEEAQAGLQRLQERMRDPRWAQDVESQGFLHEAEALLAISRAPGGE